MEPLFYYATKGQIINLLLGIVRCNNVKTIKIAVIFHFENFCKVVMNDNISAISTL